MGFCFMDSEIAFLHHRCYLSILQMNLNNVFLFSLILLLLFLKFWGFYGAKAHVLVFLS